MTPEILEFGLLIYRLVIQRRRNKPAKHYWCFVPFKAYAIYEKKHSHFCITYSSKNGKEKQQQKIYKKEKQGKKDVLYCVELPDRFFVFYCNGQCKTTLKSIWNNVHSFFIYMISKSASQNIGGPGVNKKHGYFWKTILKRQFWSLFKSTDHSLTQIVLSVRNGIYFHSIGD